MTTSTVTCHHCEAEFYIETDGDILFCIECGDSLLHGEWNKHRDDEELDEDY